MAKPTVSIIIVHYKAQVELESCLESIVSEEDTDSLEVIIFNNDTQQSLSLLTIPPQLKVTILNKHQNVGFGRACNLAAQQATGRFIFFLNPDTQLKNKAISRCVEFLEQHSEFGAVAPVLLDDRGLPYPELGSMKYTWWSFIVTESVLKKLLYSINLHTDHFLTHSNNQTVKLVDVVPGTAFVMKKALFEQLNGFDQRFFLYYEDLDLCHRIQAQGLQLAIISNAKIMHHWGVAARREQLSHSYFLNSRWKYAQKYFGPVWGTVAYYLVTVHWTVWLALASLLLLGILAGVVSY